MKYRKKPIVVEAVRYFANNQESWDAVCNLTFHQHSEPPMLFGIKTLEGEMTVSDGDWVIKGAAGELYPCKPEIFNRSYEKVVEQ